MALHIKMAGIDHQRAVLEERELFAFTAQQSRAAMEEICAQRGVEGCVLLSTCNRTELWISYTDERMEADPFDQLCRWKEVSPEDYSHVVVEREGEQAARHLFALASGMRSRIFGEDQIITQVKNAVAAAREAGCAGPVLEMLFRSAVTAAKRVKTSLHLTGRDVSSATAAADRLERELGSLAGRRAMVIGNGEMGRLAASTLVERGCDVCMTVRAYHRGEVVIPAGCRVVSYEERMKQLPQMEVVVSATTSPHHTVKYEEVADLSFAGPCWMVDLAVPRDIESRVAQIPGVRVLTIDDLQVETDPERQRQCQRAEAILREELEEFLNWYAFRDLVPAIEDISGETAAYILDRVGDEMDEQTAAHVERVSRRAVGRLLYGLRDSMPRSQWRQCLTALYKAAMK
ncbi:MAG: glutamyl-tRNA reductase [Eubacteriales bacterium]|jgi:glutamyl-tRNA reductase